MTTGIAWGRGLMQSDEEMATAAELERCLGLAPQRLTSMPPRELSDDTRALMAATLDFLLSAPAGSLGPSLGPLLTPTPPLLRTLLRRMRQPRERVAIVLAVLIMRAGVPLEPRHVRLLRGLRYSLPTIEMQLQLVAALDQSRDGVPWILGSKNKDYTVRAAMDGPTEYDRGNEFYYSGLGHSADAKPTSWMASTSCFGCEKLDDGTLGRCAVCKLARYCSQKCLKADWKRHQLVCTPRERSRQCPVPEAYIVPDWAKAWIDEHVPALRVAQAVKEDGTVMNNVSID
ncbi:hypothetical protein GGR56DRAFT_670808 [Xylariaceae sp. FL0804]|nr:hypothetical protein GGR56DRAFT_670808 [Xylariaceae sp. FL0804]